MEVDPNHVGGVAATVLGVTIENGFDATGGGAGILLASQTNGPRTS